MRLVARLLLCTVTLAWTVNANVEKTIFLGPRAAALSNALPSIDTLASSALSPASSILSTRIPVEFPTESAPRGLESWHLVRRLDHGRRYEVRVCWPATQPTDFWLDTYTLGHVLNTPGLKASLVRYSQQDQLDDHKGTGADLNAPESALLLRLQAAASYYSTNRTLMLHPPPVDVDIILDPFLLNVFPQSLGPVAVYITLVAVFAYLFSGYIFRWLLSVAAEPSSKPHTD
ncbi:hypothetical protein COCC4DRAFT_193000 [Bipolaris maydis ATCC 48331]|uniref:Protein PBN1 n=2 Tax=Cochliobolus heterostrophus TaxID=5016 RepID=M2UI54_COCH5|nr:uncharacterized protein COCC4DRAFT_193000 [Bipolaris maydis ATCC 48331]EMD87627.1 hypothetical protein COCHEDRAFT_1184872 [Bipolaris maydis C5]ENI06826.1 hypothetical protein COCC4DRAFT_193000 [Bipolaris maydis ATCC 48331]KAJ5056142.1 hypothetical protein J3E74DRAFT_280415 [Bipolaris maydis]KAJ6211979.1 hypothetical protein PSV09DRAFT_1184872 [Bipolaris maydis]